jgi:hypothetical protein
MDDPLSLRLLPALVGAIVGSTVVAIGWLVSHYFAVKRDHVNKCREIRLNFMLEAYRRIESIVGNRLATAEFSRGFEQAIADIQLLGTAEQIEELDRYMKDLRAAPSGVGPARLLGMLRAELRKELGLAHVPVSKSYRVETEKVSLSTRTTLPA